MEKNHKHLVLNAFVKNPINTAEECECWLAELANIVEMDILIPPVAKYCDIEGNEGVTGTIVITTSHMSVHIWPTEKPYIRMDVYSCKDFCVDKVVKYLDDTMGVVEEGHILIDRNALKPKLLCCAGHKCQAKKA